MRCPKCGFISFDHLDTCLKCNKNIKSTSENLQGSVYHVAAPAFLKFATEPAGAEVDLPDPFVDDDVFADEEIRDPDLDILLEEGSEDEDVEIKLGGDEPEEADTDFTIEDEEEEEGGISFSLEGFDDDADLPDAQGRDRDEPAAKPLKLDLPGELSDMSDLEGPMLQEVAEPAGKAPGDFDLDLDFDLNLEDEDLGAVAKEARSADLGALSLNDLDLDEELEPAPTKKKPAARKPDLDDELNFELDLGDLRLDDKE